MDSLSVGIRRSIGLREHNDLYADRRQLISPLSPAWTTQDPSPWTYRTLQALSEQYLSRPESIAMNEPTYDPSRPLPTTTLVYQYKLVNCPGKTIAGLLVEYPPDGATPPHRHGGASVSAYVTQGSVLNKMNNDPMQVIAKGESWYEAPGCHHRISANASKTEPAAFFVTFVLDTETLEREGPAVLVQYDEEYREVVAQKMKA